MIQQYKDVRKVRPIAENLLDEKRLLPYMQESETIYLKPLISPLFYKELSDYVAYINQVIDPENPIVLEHNAEFDILLNGGLYDNNESEVIGLTEALGYLTYARFVANQQVNVTAFGVVSKKTDYSDPIDEKTLVRVTKDAENIGKEYLRQCIEYMKFIGKIRIDKKINKIMKFTSIGD